jgi:hypothetical protein
MCHQLRSKVPNSSGYCFCVCSDHALFICYPPPASRMAEEALAEYTGSSLALIGEWDGDTGTPAFTRHLQAHWNLQTTISLPNWTDTAHDLTIWRRRECVEAGSSDSSKGPIAEHQCTPWPLCCQSGTPLTTVNPCTASRW